MWEGFRFPIAIGLLAQRRGLSFAASKAAAWASRRVEPSEAMAFAIHCLKVFQKEARAKKAEMEWRV